MSSVTVNERDGTAAVIISLSESSNATVTAYTQVGSANGGGEDFLWLYAKSAV